MGKNYRNWTRISLWFLLNYSFNRSEYFVHSSGCTDKIKDGDAVSFDLKDGKKGLNAVSVKLT